MKNVISTILAVLIVAVISLTGSSCKKEQKAAVPPSTPEQKAKMEEVKKDVEAAKKDIVAQVNGVDISMLDLIGEMNTIAQRERAKAGGEKTPASMEKVKKEGLDNLIFKELAIQESTKQGIVVSPERVAIIVDLMKKQTGSKEAFQQYLDERHMTEADLRTRIERSQRFEMITAKEIFQKIKLDDKDIRADYDKNRNEYKDSTGKQLTYEESANFIRKKLISEKGAVLKKEWAKALRKNAKIVIEKDSGK
ncbi:MAG: SurA N-terminal domain-containing protein [Nitrospirota bacterium]